MYAQPKTVHQKLISFPDPIYKRAMAQVKKTGLSFSEYIRFLVLQHSSSFFISDEIEKLNKEDSLSVQQGVNDIKAGRYTTIKTPKELREYFDNI